MSKFPCSLTRNMTSHSMENLTFIAYSDKKWLYYKFLLHHSYNRFLKGWENTLFELRIKMVWCHTHKTISSCFLWKWTENTSQGAIEVVENHFALNKFKAWVTVNKLIWLYRPHPDHAIDLLTTYRLPGFTNHIPTGSTCSLLPKACGTYCWRNLSLVVPSVTWPDWHWIWYQINMKSLWLWSVCCTVRRNLSLWHAIWSS